jgi:hypothetical protein
MIPLFICINRAIIKKGITFYEVNYMELVTAYLYNFCPLRVTGIASNTFHWLKKSGWYSDLRKSAKYQIMNKRFQINEQWFRVIVRFEHDASTGLYLLSMPLPFVIIETFTEDGVSFKDNQVFHGRTMKNTVGYIQAGIPIELIDTVIADLKENVQYVDELPKELSF